MRKLTTRDDVINLLTASISSMALGAAIETGLLQRLADRPLSGEDVSRAMNIPGKRGHYWLQLLAELGILEKHPQGYAPTALARSVFVDSDDCDRMMLKHWAADQREHLAGIRNLALHLSEASIWEAQRLATPKGYVANMRDDPERAYAFTKWLHKLHHKLAMNLADVLDLAGVHRLMDVGGGAGVVSMALVRQHPDLTTVVVDVENVCAVGRKIVEESHLSDRIEFLAADFVSDAIPQGFDFVLHCDVGVFGEDLFRKLRAALKPGGRIAVVFHFPSSESAAPVQFLEWAFLDSLGDPGFAFPTLAQVQAQLAEAGFHLVPGEHALPDGRILLQARK